MRAMVEALEAVKSRGKALSEWEVKCIQTAWKSHHDHIHAHHSNEDILLTPFLNERFKVPEKVCSKR